MRYYLILAAKIFLVALFLWAGMVFIFMRGALRSTLYETHTFPGTSNPVIEIRFRGFLDASYSAYTKGLIGRRRLICLPSGHSGQGTANISPRVGQGFAEAEKAWKPKYGVVWSSDGTRIAFVLDGWYVAACDLKTGERIDFQQYPLNINEKDNLIDKFIKKAQPSPAPYSSPAAGSESGEA